MLVEDMDATLDEMEARSAKLNALLYVLYITTAALTVLVLIVAAVTMWWVVR